MKQTLGITGICLEDNTATFHHALYREDMPNCVETYAYLNVEFEITDTNEGGCFSIAEGEWLQIHTIGLGVRHSGYELTAERWVTLRKAIGEYLVKLIHACTTVSL